MNIDPKDLKFANVVIATAVKRLRVRGVIRRDDQEDLCSELRVRLLAAWGRFDPSRGPREAFINQIVRTQLASILRARNAQKRSATICPMESVAEPTVDVESSDGKWQEVSDMRIDMDGPVHLLSPLEQEIVDNLRRDSLNQVAEQMDVPRRTLRDRRDRIREIFEICGLDAYLPNPPPRDGRFA